MSSPRIQAWSGSATPRNSFCSTASASTWDHDDVVQRDLAGLALVHLGRVLAGDGRDLVGDGDDRVEALVAGDVEVVLQLLGCELVRAGLHLHQGGPGLRAAGDPDEPVGVEPLLAEDERHLDEALQRAGRRAERLDERATELLDRAEHRQQCGGRPALLLLGAVDARRRDEPRLVPGLLAMYLSPV